MVNGWKECLITDVLKQDGIKIGPFGSQLKKEMLLNDGFLKVYGQENVYENDFNIGDRYLTREHFEKLKSCEILPGDFLMSTMGTIGKCAIVPPNIMPGIMDSHLIRLRFDESMINPEYVLQLFSDQYSFLQNQIQKLAVGGIMDGLSVGIVSNIKIVFPEDLEEQNCIVSTLKDADKLIHESQLLMEKYQAMKQGCLQHMFPRKGQTEPDVRLPGFTGVWEQRKLADVVGATYGGGTPATANEAFWNGDIPWIQSSNTIEGQLFDVDVKKHISRDGLTHSATQIIPANSVAVVTHVGVGKLVFMPYSYTTSQDFISLSNLKCSPQFLCYALYRKLQEDLHIVQGSAIKGITKEDLMIKQLAMPEIEEQEQIANTLETLDRLITLHQRKCEKYKMIKQGMMEDLLTGKVRLK